MSGENTTTGRYYTGTPQPPPSTKTGEVQLSTKHETQNTHVYRNITNTKRRSPNYIETPAITAPPPPTSNANSHSYDNCKFERREQQDALARLRGRRRRSCTVLVRSSSATRAFKHPSVAFVQKAVGNCVVEDVRAPRHGVWRIPQFYVGGTEERRSDSIIQCQARTTVA